MRSSESGVAVDCKRLPDGTLQLTFYRVSLGFRSWMCAIRKVPGETVEDELFLRGPGRKADWVFRVIYGLGEMQPVLRVYDCGSSIAFYHGWDRKQRERIYCNANVANGGSGGGIMLVGRESFGELRAAVAEAEEVHGRGGL